ncbi:uncharacterized protein [Amphiura filiformis]|uniref:uncharacterized protein isoform X1 n=1 Tax=Amphiura filiformis TaxID=82378 RepID=UPI003B20C9EE
MEDDSGWIVDSIVQFLVSPIWRTPVLGFLDAKCIVFDPDHLEASKEKEKEKAYKEQEKAYRELHEEYKTIVQFLLDSFLEDIGINGDQFVEACKKQGNDRPEAVLTAFEQVEAARNFKLFKSMMMKRNVDLELQALMMIQERNGVVPGILQPGEDTKIEYSQAVVDSEEDKILQEVLRKSQEEYEAQKGKGKDIDEDLEKALAHSKEDAQRLADRKHEEEQMLSKVMTQSKDEEERRKRKQSDEQLREKTLKMSISDEKKSSSTSSLPPVKGSAKPSSKPSTASSSKPAASTSPPPSTSSKSPTPSAVSAVSNAEAAANWLSSAKAEAAAEPGRTSRSSAMSGADPAELKRREEYLKKQREKILAMKQQERQKNLQAYTASNSGAKARPKSARAAKQVTSGDMNIETKSDAEQEKQLAMRKALAERLKQEVVNKK